MSNLSRSQSIATKDYFSTDHLRSKLRNRALKGTTVTITTQAFSFGVSTIGTIVLSRLLTPTDFGLVTMVLFFSTLLQSFGVNGFLEATIQREEITHEQVSTIFWMNVGFSFILALVFIACAPLIAWFYHEPRLKSIVLALAFSILIAGFSTQHQALLARNMKFAQTAVCELAAMLSSIAVAIFLAWLGWGYWALVMKWVVSPLVLTISAWILCGWRPGLPVKKCGIMPMLHYAFNTYGNYILRYLSKNFDKALIGRFLGSQSLGSYDRAFQLALMLPNQLVIPLSNVAISTFSKLKGDSVKYCQSYLLVVSTLAFICMPLSVTLMLIGKDLILFLLGPQWTMAGRIFSIFGLSIGVLMISMTQSWIHLSLGTPGRWLRWSILSLIVTSAALIIGLKFGPLGVAAGYSISIYLLVGPSLWYAGKPIGLKFSSVFSKVWRSFAGALASGFLCWYLFYRCSPISTIFPTYPILVRIIVSALLNMGIYLILIIVLYRSVRPITQFISIIGEMLLKERKKNK